MAILIKDNDDTHKEDEHCSKVGSMVCTYNKGGDVNTKTKCKVGHSTKQQACSHNQTSFNTVNYVTINEARCTINQRAYKQYPAEALV